MGLRGFWVVVALAATACGDGGSADDDAAIDAADEPVAIDAGVDAPPDVIPDVRDAAKEADADSGIPPLACTGEANEPNESEILAYPLGTIDDCDSSGSSFSDVSSGKGDVDWFVFHGKDTFGCSVDPTLQIDATGLRMCAFALCDDGTTTIQSCGIGASATSPAGTHGCCTTSTQSMKMQINCSGTNDSAAMYIRVDQPTTNQCVSYDVSYHY